MRDGSVHTFLALRPHRSLLLRGHHKSFPIGPETLGSKSYRDGPGLAVAPPGAALGSAAVACGGDPAPAAPLAAICASEPASRAHAPAARPRRAARLRRHRWRRWALRSAALQRRAAATPPLLPRLPRRRRTRLARAPAARPRGAAPLRGCLQKLHQQGSRCAQDRWPCE